MERFVIERNIARYREMLRHARDEEQRRNIERLLDEERAKLAALAARVSERRLMRDDGSPFLVLIVEAGATAATELAALVRDWGGEVIGRTRTAHRAIEMIDRRRPDLVIIEIHPPGAMDAIDGAHAIQARYGVPIVFLTEIDDTATRVRMSAVQRSAVAPKPLVATRLREAILLACEM